MGKKAKSIRHALKMAARRKDKLARNLAYASMAEKGDNSKTKHKKYVKPLIRVRDPRCKNIGDILSFPEQVTQTLLRFDRSSYKGKYKNQLAYVRMMARYANNLTIMDKWFNIPIKNHLGQTIARRDLSTIWKVNIVK